MTSTVFVLLVACCCCLTLAALAWHDLRRRRLPNRLVAVLGALYLVFALFAHDALLPHLATGAVTLLIAMILTARGYMGGGDAKLLTVVLCWSGTSLLLPTLLFITQAGLIVGLAGWLARKLRQTRPRLRRMTLLRCLTAERGVPYGVALAIGGAFAILVQINRF